MIGICSDDNNSFIADDAYIKAHMRRAKALGSLNRWDEAVAECDKVFNSFPGDKTMAEALTEARKGEMSAKGGDPSKAKVATAGCKYIESDEEYDAVFKAALPHQLIAVDFTAVRLYVFSSFRLKIALMINSINLCIINLLITSF